LKVGTLYYFLENNQLFLFGSNEKGQLGCSKEDQFQATPCQIFNQVEEGSEPRYVFEASCGSYSTICITEENEIFFWGQIPGSSHIAADPIFIGKSMPLLELQELIEKVFVLKPSALLMISRQRTDRDEPSSIVRESHEHSMIGGRGRGGDSSTIHSDKNSFWQQSNQMNNSAFQGQTPHGISFSKEFENLLQYIAITSGNTRMPEGVSPMTFRPSNLPPKTPEEERLH